MDNGKREYKGIDCFRIIAVILVVAIHTSPLVSVNETADFILTRILARVAVPYFFMATGFFLLPRLTASAANKMEKMASLLIFLKKTAIIYGVSIVIYLPLNIYAGHYDTVTSAFSLFKDLVFNGTFYHLWYLPASIAGVLIVYLVAEKLPGKTLIPIVMILYLIGLFGDSYYGVSAQIPLLKIFYDALFILFDYTRNGLFFAPVFLAMGWRLACAKNIIGAKKSITGFIFSLFLMIVEALILHRYNFQRHDSMYIMLLPCMYFLFQSILLWRGNSQKRLRILSMLVYILHPLCLVFVRGFAKITGWTPVLVENSPGRFAAVATASFVVCIILQAIWERMKDRPDPSGRAWVEINLSNLIWNLKSFQGILPEACSVMAVVKANAYGHGALAVSKALYKQGIHAFAVATIEEGISLRRHGIGGDILILGYTGPRDFHLLVRYRLTQTVVDCEYAGLLNSYGKKIKAHIKIDTGMNRLGENYFKPDQIARIYQYKNLIICGTYTHLCVSDSMKDEDVVFTENQIKRFYDIVTDLKELNIDTGKLHIQSSYGVLNYPELRCDYARIGIALYGALSNRDDRTRVQIELRPVFSLKARIVLTKTVAKGETVGYGHKFTSLRDLLIAVVSIGYADGLPRNLSSGGGYVLIKGQRAQIIGSICMDQMMVDITDIEGVRPDDIATIIGQDRNERITAEQVAYQTGTITNELLSRMSNNRIKRFLKNN